MIFVLKTGAAANTYSHIYLEYSGPSCSKLMTQFVDETLNFQKYDV